MATDHDAIIATLASYFRNKGLDAITSQGTRSGPDLQVENTVAKTVEHVEVELDASMSSKVFQGIDSSTELAKRWNFKLRIWFVSSSDKHLKMFRKKRPTIPAEWLHAYKVCDKTYLDSAFGLQEGLISDLDRSCGV